MSLQDTRGDAPGSAPEGTEWPRYRVTLQYLGTRYHGWQIQSGRLTVQEVLQERLSRLAGSSVKVAGASRTDSGVHALGQVAHFDFPTKPSIPDLKRTLNAVLPWDIRVIELSKVPTSFHAQRSALRKRYHYRIFRDEVLPPFEHNLALHHPASLDCDAVDEAVRMLRGTHDFSGFAAASTTVKNRVRTVFEAQLWAESEILSFGIEADGFLHHMIRNIVGTLLQIGTGKRSPGNISEIIEARDRAMAGPTAPAHGLYLVHIWY